MGEDVGSGGSVELFPRDARGEVQDRVEGVEAEEVAMDGSWRGSGAAIADFAEVVLSLAGARVEGIRGEETFGEGAGVGWDVEDDPMDPVPTGASGSSQTRAKLFVPWGGCDQARGGERSGPSAVYFSGIMSASVKAALVRSMDMASSPCTGGGDADFGEQAAKRTIVRRTIRDKRGIESGLHRGRGFQKKYTTEEADVKRLKADVG